MRRVLCAVGRGVSVLSLSVVLSGGLFAAETIGGEPREKERRHPVVKVVKKVIRSLGDLLTIPKP